MPIHDESHVRQCVSTLDEFVAEQGINTPTVSREWLTEQNDIRNTLEAESLVEEQRFALPRIKVERQ